jgi:23S rRNA (cytidine1920-2'-O)/16S rRNA (cytidine1409-2'-O)-methyltransferase
MCDACVSAVTEIPAPGAPRGSVRPVSKVRLDAALAEKGLFPSRAAAAASVRAGGVRIGTDGPLALKPGQLVDSAQELIVEQPPRFVSRGGIKLENALAALGVRVAGRACLDVGASTGGFTDCLLQHGAAGVAAVDVGYGQLDQRLREDKRVTVIERRNARDLGPADLPFAAELATIDLSFISLRKVLPAVARCLAPGGDVIALVKPQFELRRERVGKGGVVRSATDRREAILAVAAAARDLGLPIRGLASSGLPGPKGNRETFVWAGGEDPGIHDLESAVLGVEP